jgi:hypothetical protein
MTPDESPNAGASSSKPPHENDHPPQLVFPVNEIPYVRSDARHDSFESVDALIQVSDGLFDARLRARYLNKRFEDALTLRRRRDVVHSPFRQINGQRV